ncbi:putative IST1 [Paratrimastix pyriformis]|uniref:IST1 n=1 Tax=Paratrimastix pyriformis TaxID=342808 RepID=A0ABQ8UMU4_9EUKA|nr:putative IST1 [Paratrimastix pyriformis]|eukprot:GAFH01002881.1.p1 GENE.GAFH01002881.1~~GAFH01002881.1.p1  ORF type:complete len:334 (+),score=45.18 GAFH01002881.1:40-1002(+)
MGFDQNKTKIHLKTAVIRMQMLKQKKDAQNKAAKQEVAQLLRVGKDELARIKCENIVRQDYLIDALEILESFCELVTARLPLIASQRECPPELMESICSLIYSATHAEVPELLEVKKDFASKYGKQFVEDAVNNRGNRVNQRITIKFSVQTPPLQLLFQYLESAAKADGVDWHAPADSAAIPDLIQFPQPGAAGPSVAVETGAIPMLSFPGQFPPPPNPFLAGVAYPPGAMFQPPAQGPINLTLQFPGSPATATATATGPSVPVQTSLQAIPPPVPAAPAFPGTPVDPTNVPPPPPPAPDAMGSSQYDALAARFEAFKKR